MWWNWRRKRRRHEVPPKLAAAAEETRIERGKLAAAIMELDRARLQLMARMLEERRHV